MNNILSRFTFLESGWRIVPISDVGGFSGARVWRIAAGERTFCLKRWPQEHPDRHRLEFIHGVLQHVASQGLAVVAVPLTDRTGNSIIEHDGSYFELTQWLPGEANFERRPSAEKLAAAMTILARFHNFASTKYSTWAASDGIADRRRQVTNLVSGELKQISAAIQHKDWPLLSELAREFLTLVPSLLPRLQASLDRASAWKVPIQPCIRDIWHDHVLFTGDEVTGIVDFGSLRMESVAGDLARLMGSLVADDLPQRNAALSAYDKIRALSPVERELVDVFDQASIVLGGINWLRWIYCEDRVFENREKVEFRFSFLLRRLRLAAAVSMSSATVGLPT